MKLSKFKINVLSNLLIKLLVAVIPFVLSPFVSRALLPEGLGNFSYAHSIASYFSIIVAFGFINYGTKKVAENRDDKIKASHSFWNILFIKFILFAVVTAVYVCVISSFDLTKGFDNSIYYALIALIAGSLFDITFYFQGKEKMFVFSLVNLFVNLTYALLVIFLVKTPSDLLIYTILKSSITLATSLVAVPFIFNEIRYLPKLNVKELWKTFVECFAYFIPSLILTITPIIDQTMIGALSNTTQVGYYEAANKIKTIALVFSAAISSILLSRVAYLRSSNDDEAANDKILASINSSMFIIIPLVFGICSISYLFFPLYYGTEFAFSSNVMLMLAPSTLFSSFITILLFGYFFAKGKTFVATISIVICDVINVVTNIFGIKYFGALGAAFTSSFSNMLLLFACIWFSRKDINYKKIIKNLLKCLISAAFIPLFAFVVAKILHIYNVSNDALVLVLMIFVGVMIYFVACLSFGEENIVGVVNAISRQLDRSHKKEAKLTICHYCYGLKPYKTGGVPEYLNYLINKQDSENNIIVLYPGHYSMFSSKPRIKQGGLYQKDKRFECFEIINPKPIPICNGVKEINEYVKDYPIEMWDSFLKENKIDVIHIHTLFGLDLNFLNACKNNNIKTIFTSHDLYGICPKVVPLFMNYCKLEPSALCSVCSNHAFSKKENRLLQSNLYNKLKRSTLLKIIRKKKINDRVKYQKATTEIDDNRIKQLFDQKSSDYQKLQKYYINLINGFDCVHFNSELSKETFLKFTNPKNSFVRHIFTENIKDNRKKHSKEVDEKNINLLILGTGKGMYKIIDALKEIWNSGITNFSLSIHSANNCINEPFIHKYGAYKQDELDAIFNSSDVLLFEETSFASLSFIIIEALSYGVPVVASGLVGAKDIIKETKGGTFVDGPDHMFKSTILNILKNPEIIKKWQTSLKESEYSFEGPSFIDIYDKMLGKE